MRKGAAIWQRLHLVDISLLVFLLICLLQSAYSVLMHTDSSSFDIILRTSCASIFGYFLSTRFSPSAQTTADGSTIQSTPPTGTVAQIGFSDSSAAPTLGAASSRFLQTDNLQVALVSIIGLFCLILLIVIRNFIHMDEISASALATLTQFRDIFSGCIGFLIGHPVKQP